MLAAEAATVDLSKRTPPNIAKIGDDPFGRLVKYGYTLFIDTANEIGPSASDSTKRFAGNNLACQNCHLPAGTQPYAMPLMGIWGLHNTERERVRRHARRPHQWLPDAIADRKARIERLQELKDMLLAETLGTG